MNTKLLAKELVDRLPKEKLKIAADFLQWLQGERLRPKERNLVHQGIKEIARGNYVRWRNVKRTKV